MTFTSNGKKSVLISLMVMDIVAPNTDTLRILDAEKNHKSRYRCHVKNYVEGKHSDEALLTVSKLSVTIT